MPTYEYRCNACKREFEAQQKMADPDLVHCKVCHEDKLEKLISWTSVRSTGWKDALTADNPKEAMKGTHAVDVGRPPSARGGAAGSSADAPATTCPRCAAAVEAGIAG